MLFLQIAPSFFFDTKKRITDFSKQKVSVGCLPVRGEITNTDWHIRQLKSFAEDDSIKAIVARIDSPGGYPAASQALYQALLMAKSKKPLIVEIQNVACSGAYYIAIAADHIIALPSSLVGNIGVIMQLFNLKQTVEYCHAGVEYIKSGNYKDAGSQFANLTPEQRTYLQATSDDIYLQFLTDVATERKVSLDKKTEWADGKAFTGKQALALQLIDELGGNTEVIKALQSRLKTEHEIQFIYPTAPSFLQRLTGEDDYTNEHNRMDFSSIISSLVLHFFHKENLSLENRFYMK